MMNNRYREKDIVDKQRVLIEGFQEELGLDIYSDLIKALYFHIQSMQRKYNMRVKLPRGGEKRINPLTYFTEYNRVYINRIVLSMYKLSSIAESINKELMDDRRVSFCDFYAINKDLMPSCIIDEAIFKISDSIKDILYHNNENSDNGYDATMWEHDRVRIEASIIRDESYPKKLARKLIGEFVKVHGHLI